MQSRGTEFLDAETRRKFSRGERNFWMQRPEAKKPPERPLLSAETGNVENRRQDPRRKGLFSIDDGFRGSGRLDGGGTRAQTGDPPPSHRTSLRRRAGNGNLRCRDGHAKAGSLPSRDQSRDAQECEKPPFRRNKCEKADGSLSPTTGWWRPSGPNWLLPTQRSNQSPKLEPGTEFFAAETGRRNGLIRLDYSSRPRHFVEL